MLSSLIAAVGDLNEEKVMNLVKFHISNGEPVFEIINSINTGMMKVGKLFETKDYYVADLIMAGIIFHEVLDMKEVIAYFKSKEVYEVKPVILLGTVKGDLHDIGKKIFSGMAEASGFEVVDIGIDTDVEVFLDNYHRYAPDIIAMSGLLSDSVRHMKAVVDLFREKGLRDKVKFIVGGSPVNKETCDFIGADGYSTDVNKSIELCEKWISEKRGFAGDDATL